MTSARFIAIQLCASVCVLINAAKSDEYVPTDVMEKQVKILRRMQNKFGCGDHRAEMDQKMLNELFDSTWDINTGEVLAKFKFRPNSEKSRKRYYKRIVDTLTHSLAYVSGEVEYFKCLGAKIRKHGIQPYMKLLQKARVAAQSWEDVFPYLWPMVMKLKDQPTSASSVSPMHLNHHVIGWMTTSINQYFSGQLRQDVLDMLQQYSEKLLEFEYQFKDVQRGWQPEARAKRQSKKRGKGSTKKGPRQHASSEVPLPDKQHIKSQPAPFSYVTLIISVGLAACGLKCFARLVRQPAGKENATSRHQSGELAQALDSGRCFSNALLPCPFEKKDQGIDACCICMEREPACVGDACSHAPVVCNPCWRRMVYQELRKAGAKHLPSARELTSKHIRRTAVTCPLCRRAGRLSLPPRGPDTPSLVNVATPVGPRERKC